VAKSGRRSLDQPTFTAKEALSRSLQLFSKHFRKGFSRQFGCYRGGLLTLRSVLLEHVTYILHQSFELPHFFLTKLLDAFVLYARYDLISYPPQLPSSLR
jgi:hypothetical protein